MRNIINGPIKLHFTRHSCVMKSSFYVLNFSCLCLGHILLQHNCAGDVWWYSHITLSMWQCHLNCFTCRFKPVLCSELWVPLSSQPSGRSLLLSRWLYSGQWQPFLCGWVKFRCSFKTLKRFTLHNLNIAESRLLFITKLWLVFTIKSKYDHYVYVDYVMAFNDFT